MRPATASARSVDASTAAVESVARQTDWHALNADYVVCALGVDPTFGLANSEVTARQLRYGPNALQRIQPRPAWRVLVDQFASIVIALLAFASEVAWITGASAEAVAIAVVLVLN